MGSGTTEATRLRVDLAYDGGPFRGFARQRDHVTVQGTLDGALTRLLGEDIVTTGAGRTDRGVHAIAQVAHFDVAPDSHAARRLEDLDRARRSLQSLVGDAITIWRLSRPREGFHARFSATERRYRYRLADAPAIDPRDRSRVWHVVEPVAIGAMRAGGRHLLGEHDFSTFCRKAEGKHRVRSVSALTIARAPDGAVDVRVRGPAFCHQQVRSIVGALVWVGHGKAAPEWIGELLTHRDRRLAPPIAPPHGLTLEAVRYGRAHPAAPPTAR